jgi:hypothetical protein
MRGGSNPDGAVAVIQQSFEFGIRFAGKRYNADGNAAEAQNAGLRAQPDISFAVFKDRIDRATVEIGGRDMLESAVAAIVDSPAKAM